MLLLIPLLYGTWFGMLVTHEAGHVIHAWISGCRVAHIELPLLGFSRTDVDENAHPLFVAWGGPLWGCLLPLAILLIARAARFRYWRILLFFAGFCLLANGAYLSFGSLYRAGDAGDLMRRGAPQWTLFLFGAMTMPTGLFLWHRLGPRFGIGTAQEQWH